MVSGSAGEVEGHRRRGRPLLRLPRAPLLCLQSGAASPLHCGLQIVALRLGRANQRDSTKPRLNASFVFGLCEMCCAWSRMLGMTLGLYQTSESGLYVGAARGTPDPRL